MSQLTDVSYDALHYSKDGVIPTQTEPLVTGVSGTVVSVVQNGDAYLITVQANKPIFWPQGYEGRRNETAFRFFTSTVLTVGQQAIFDLWGATTPSVVVMPCNVNV